MLSHQLMDVISMSFSMIQLLASTTYGVGWGAFVDEQFPAKRVVVQPPIDPKPDPISVAQDRRKAIYDLEANIKHIHKLHTVADGIQFQKYVSQTAELHTDLASRFLIRYITVGAVLTDGGPPLTGFPAAYELSRLGSNAYPAIFHKLDGDCTEREITILAQTIAYIDGIELAQTRLQIAMRPRVHGRSGPVIRDGTERTTVFAKNAQRILDLLSDKGFLTRDIQWAGK